MRICSTCRISYPLDNFYRDFRRAEGRGYRCKNCERLRYRERREKNANTFRQKDRRYYRKNRKKILTKRKIDYQLNGYKHKAREAVKTALYKGILFRQNCIVCGVDKTEAHHPDYTKPLMVVWLCKKHHQRVHT